MSEADLRELPSPNFDERDGPPDMLLMHYTGMASGEDARALLTDPAPMAARYAGVAPGVPDDPDLALARVSAHYVVEEDGRVFRLVAEDKRAWHAGRASWAGDDGVNARAIGFEIVNGGHHYGLPEFPSAQIQAVIAVAKASMERWAIPPWRVLGHSDVAPGRKTDPGPRFPWFALADEGVGLALSVDGGAPHILLTRGDHGAGVERLQRRLSAWGYCVAQTGSFDAETEAVVAAFHDRWRQEGEDCPQRPVWRALDEARLEGLFTAAGDAAAKASQAGRAYASAPPRA